METLKFFMKFNKQFNKEKNTSEFDEWLSNWRRVRMVRAFANHLNILDFGKLSKFQGWMSIQRKLQQLQTKIINLILMIKYSDFFSEIETFVVELKTK